MANVNQDENVQPSVANNENSTSEPEKRLGGCTGKGFMPGQSGNPTGRPKKKWLTEVAEELLEEKLADPKFREQYKEHLWGNLLSSKVVGAMTLDKVWERTEGKVVQPVQVDGELALTLSDRIAKARTKLDGDPSK